MAEDIEEFLEETDEQLGSLLNTVNRRTDIFKQYTRDEVDDETYIEERERTGEVKSELLETGNRVDYVHQFFFEESIDDELRDEYDGIEGTTGMGQEELMEAREEVMEMKGLYDGLVTRLKEAENTVLGRVRDDEEFDPAYRAVIEGPDS